MVYGASRGADGVTVLLDERHGESHSGGMLLPRMQHCLRVPVSRGKVRCIVTVVDRRRAAAVLPGETTEFLFLQTTGCYSF